MFHCQNVCAGSLSESLAVDAPGAGEHWTRPIVERQLAMLERLAQVGLEVAEAIGRRAKADSVDVGDLALAYHRASRAMRLTIAMQSKLIADLRRIDSDRKVEAQTAEVRRDCARKAARDAHRAADHAHKGRIQVIINRIADVEHPDRPDVVDRLVDEACLQLRDNDRFGDVLKRPISEVVALICRDLGLSPDWPRLAEEAWARQEITSGKVGPPLAGLAAKDRREAQEGPPPEGRATSAAPPDRRVVHAAPS